MLSLRPKDIRKLLLDLGISRSVLDEHLSSRDSVHRSLQSSTSSRSFAQFEETASFGVCSLLSEWREDVSDRVVCFSVAKRSKKADSSRENSFRVCKANTNKSVSIRVLVQGEIHLNLFEIVAIFREMRMSRESLME